MDFKIGDIVTRKSHHNDMTFIITDIDNNTCYLKGVNIRLEADALIDDLEKYDGDDTEEKEFEERLKPEDLNRDDYFYLPGKILHIDADPDYLKRCLDYYEKMNIWAKGIKEKEENIKVHIKDWINEYNPNIVVITGHDAYYKKKGSTSDIKAYKNSMNFIDAIKEARKVEKSHDKLIIIAGACQSDYEDLIKAGANFASSPKRINIHALDPAIVASKMSLSDVGTDIDLKSILESTKYGSSGMGGVKTKGTMYIGYPR
ncbi:MAG: sporulation peptidase YabG [Bacilli bacterium]|nr:sporulation peptidase YabG [Bacilli bacterium]